VVHAAWPAVQIAGLAGMWTRWQSGMGVDGHVAPLVRADAGLRNCSFPTQGDNDREVYSTGSFLQTGTAMDNHGSNHWSEVSTEQSLGHKHGTVLGHKHDWGQVGGNPPLPNLYQVTIVRS
jgi:hypothetical protein